MTITVWPVNAVSGAPAYSGKMARQAMSAVLAGATSARPLGARSGVRIGTPTNTITVSGLTVTIAPHAGVIDKQASATAGPYWYASDTNATLTLNAAHATLARIDLITARIDDPAESDGSSVPAVVFVYTAGTASGSPVAPSPATSREMTLATVAVPASGGGSAVVSWVAPYTGVPGGFVPVRTTTERNALATAITPSLVNPAVTVRADATAGAELEYNVGSGWNIIQAYDSGWVTVTLAAGYTATQPVQVRRIGQLVYMRGVITPTTNWGVSMANNIVVAAGGIPAAMSTTSYVTTQPASPFGANYAAFRCAPQADGSLIINCGTATSAIGVYLSGVTWPVG